MASIVVLALAEGDVISILEITSLLLSLWFLASESKRLNQVQRENDSWEGAYFSSITKWKWTEHTKQVRKFGCQDYMTNGNCSCLSTKQGQWLMISSMLFFSCHQPSDHWSIYEYIAHSDGQYLCRVSCSHFSPENRPGHCDFPLSKQGDKMLSKGCLLSRCSKIFTSKVIPQFPQHFICMMIKDHLLSLIISKPNLFCCCKVPLIWEGRG